MLKFDFFPKLQTSDKISTLLFLESMLLGFWAFVLVFFSTEIGQRFINTFEEIDKEIYQINWYRLPIRIQRMLPTIKINTQSLMAIECFGSLAVNHETFQKVSSIESIQNEKETAVGWAFKTSQFIPLCFRWLTKHIPISCYFENFIIEPTSRTALTCKWITTWQMRFSVFSVV